MSFNLAFVVFAADGCLKVLTFSSRNGKPISRSSSRAAVRVTQHLQEFGLLRSPQSSESQGPDPDPDPGKAELE